MRKNIFDSLFQKTAKNDQMKAQSKKEIFRVGFAILFRSPEFQTEPLDTMSFFFYTTPEPVKEQGYYSL